MLNLDYLKRNFSNYTAACPHEEMTSHSLFRQLSMWCLVPGLSSAASLVNLLLDLVTSSQLLYSTLRKVTQTCE